MISKLAKKFSGQKMFQILNKAQQIERLGKSVYHFELGEPYHQTPKSIPKRMISSIKKGNTRYTSSFGLFELREKITQTTQHTRGFKPNLDQVLITTGANSIIYYLIKTVCNPGDEIIIPSPGFPTYIAAAKANGVKIKYLKLEEKNRYQINTYKLTKLITHKTKLIIVNSPSNPIGVMQDKETLLNFYSLIKNYKNIYVLSDEIYSRIVFNDNKFFSLSTIDECKKKIIVLNGFSKAFSMTGYRVGCAIGPKNIIEKMRILSETIVSCVPPFIQEACIAAIDLKKNFIKKDISDYKIKRDLILSKFKNTKLSLVEPNGGFYIFPSLRSYGIKSKFFCDDILTKYGIALVPGDYFGPGCSFNFRMAYTTSYDKLEYSLQKIVKLLNSYEKN